MSYQVKKLEESLDCALFRRSVRQVYLTHSGQQLLQTAQRIFADLTDAMNQIQPGNSSHDVLVGATTYVASRWLSPRIASFCEKHPSVSILLHHAVNSGSFKLQDVDFAIRWTPIQGQISHSRLFELPMSLFPVCSQRLLERIGHPSSKRKWDRTQFSQAPMNSIPLLCEDRALDLWLAWYGEVGAKLDNPRRVITDANVRVQAAIDGQGWVLADELMRHELDNGLLVAPFKHQLQGYGYSIQSAPGRFTSQNALNLKHWLLDNV